jgi:hypothetical protein
MSAGDSTDEPPESAPPGPFVDEPFAAALSRATREQRWLLVNVTDASSPACWPMAQRTWRDRSVIAWISKHAVAVEVDAERDPSTAAALAITPPAVILFREGKERVRLARFQEPHQLLRWLELVDEIEARVPEARAKLTDPDRDADGRHRLAQALQRTRRFEEALDHYVWLWLHMAEVEPAKSGVRVSFLANEIAELCRDLPAARERFCQLRDDAETAARTSSAERTGATARFDWIVLNQSLGEAARTLSWFDGLSSTEQVGLHTSIISRVVPMLLERERWADAGRLIRDPLEDLRTHGVMLHMGRTYPMLPEIVASYRGMFVETMLEGLRKEAAQLVRSLKAAGRDIDVAAVKREALRLDDSPEMRAALNEVGPDTA